MAVVDFIRSPDDQSAPLRRRLLAVTGDIRDYERRVQAARPPERGSTAPGRTSAAAKILELQRLAGNSAVRSARAGTGPSTTSAGAQIVLQRADPTRAENIAALQFELAAAAAGATKWQAVALRLNGFARADLLAICSLIPDTQLQAARSAVERHRWSFNYGGFPVSGGQTNDPNKAYTGKKGDGRNYIVWVPTLQNYLTSLWGKPDALLASNAEAVAFEAMLAPGEVAVFSGPHHSGLIMQGYSDAYVKSDPDVMPVSAWKLAM
jgi:hypothetical protein